MDFTIVQNTLKSKKHVLMEGGDFQRAPWKIQADCREYRQHTLSKDAKRTHIYIGISDFFKLSDCCGNYSQKLFYSLLLFTDFLSFIKVDKRRPEQASFARYFTKNIAVLRVKWNTTGNWNKCSAAQPPSLLWISVRGLFLDFTVIAFEHMHWNLRQLNYHI